MKIAVKFTFCSDKEDLRISETIIDWDHPSLPTTNDMISADIFKDFIPLEHTLEHEDLQLWSICWRIVKGQLMPILHLSDYWLINSR